VLILRETWRRGTGKVTEEEIGRACQTLARWQRNGQEIERTVRFPSFPDAIQFVVRVATLAEEANHHPDIDIRFRNVRLALTTHDAGGLTTKDFALAHRIDDQAVQG